MPKVTGNRHTYPGGQRTYLGIDPGAKGGLVHLRADGVVIGMTDFPDTERDLWDWVNFCSATSAIIEKVWASPNEGRKQGASGMFKFGMNYGMLRMSLIAAGIPFEEVTPQCWQKAYSISSRKDPETKTQFKNRLKAKAQQLFPKVKVTLAVADALLISEFARRKDRGLL